MNPGLYLRGLVIGFAVAFALGPIGLLVIRRTIDGGWGRGLLSGVGVATADAIYGAIAAFGLTALTTALVGIARPLGVLGGGILVVMAVHGLRAARTAGPVDAAATREVDAAGTREAAETREGAGGGAGGPGPRLAGPVGTWATMVALTLTNPATILSFTALFASIWAGLDGAGGAALVVAGVFTGSVAWWALLTGLVARLGARLSPRVVRALNAASSLVVGAFGLVAVALGVSG
jgi:putative LysE/RhtB family amino acid efflux pump